MEPIIGIALGIGFLALVGRSMVGSYKRGEMRFDNIDDVTYEASDDDFGDYDRPRRRRPPRTRDRRDYYDRPRYRDERDDRYYYDDRDDYDHYDHYAGY